MERGRLSRSEEDHLKAIHALLPHGAKAGTKDIAERLEIKASSVTVMLKRLAAKGLLKHEPYHGVKLTAKGHAAALKLVRRHRLWETFLVDRLGFGWDEVHDIAEQLEHVGSDKLTDRLDDFLGNPGFDPHGDPIPDRHGRLVERRTMPLAACPPGTRVRIATVSGSTDDLLRLLDARGLHIGTHLTVQEVHGFDASVDVKPRTGAAFSLSRDVADHLLVEPV
ncbi:MAG: metal-dependent transcriptional regulator [Flavobacteriales bacterium]|jgi:DtxR family Mn-dependent transcriptional regulator|nr:metal-dependent transcriptional regulator [Flavobacteriales bacterium]